MQAGAGIVCDSDPAAEWEETMNKGRALFRAVAQAAKGLLGARPSLDGSPSPATYPMGMPIRGSSDVRVEAR
jgi:hypothetical protein